LLLAPDQSQFQKLVQDHSIEGIRFDDAHVHVLEDSQGRPLEDIRTQADNMAMADAILHRVARFAMDDDCSIHVSLAGGRKSMGFFAGYALSLCGRPQDRLSHVLVSPDLESHPQFFFPPRVPRVLISRGQQPVSTADAIIELADIPFVRLRDRAPRALIEGGRFIEVVAAAQRLSAPPQLKLIASQRAIECGGETIVLPPMRFAVYAWHALRTLERAEPAVVLSDFDVIRSSLRRELHEFGNRLFDSEFSSECEEWNKRRWDRDSEDEKHSQWLSEQRNRINGSIAEVLGDEGRRIYGIQTIRLTGRRSAHGLDLPAGCIEFDWT
jgi:CRISPR-associated protein (TIGR02584 family)